MELFINCKNCREDFPITSPAITRGELENELGRYFKIQCSRCLSTKEYHVNNIRARAGRKQILIFGLSMLLLSVLLTWLFWNAGTVIILTVILPMVAFSYYYALKSTAANQFNRMLIKRDK